MRFLKHPFGDGRAPVRSGIAPANASPVSDSGRLPARISSAPTPLAVAHATEDARLDAVLWGALMGMWEMDVRTDQTRWANDWCEQFQLEPCPGKDHIARWDAAIHPDDRSAKAARFAALLAGTEPQFD